MAFRSERDKRALAWPVRQPILAQPLLNFRRKAQETQHISNGGAIFADAARNVFLSEAEVGDQSFVGLRFFNGIQVFALKILD